MESTPEPQDDASDKIENIWNFMKEIVKTYAQNSWLLFHTILTGVEEE